MNIRFKRHYRVMDAASGDGGAGGGGAASAGAGEGAGSGASSASGASGSASGAASGSAASGEGKPQVSDSEAKLLKENMKKKEQIEALQSQLDGAKALQSQLEELGGLDAIKSLVQAQKDAETKQLEAKGDFERLRARMAEEHTKQLKTLQEQLDQLKGVVSKKDSTINQLAIGSQFAQSKFIADELTLPPSKARVVYNDYFDIGEDGSVVGFDKPRGAAGRTPLVDGQGNAIAFDEALRKIVEADPEKDHLLKSKTKAGAASTSRQSAQQTPSQQAQSRTPISKIAAGLSSLGRIHNG